VTKELCIFVIPPVLLLLNYNWIILLLLHVIATMIVAKDVATKTISTPTQGSPDNFKGMLPFPTAFKGMAALNFCLSAWWLDVNESHDGNAKALVGSSLCHWVD
jgi:hypothetical protein